MDLLPLTRPATFTDSRGTLWEWWRARSTMLATVDLDSNSEKKPVGKPPTRARGTGSQRVDKV